MSSDNKKNKNPGVRGPKGPNFQGQAPGNPPPKKATPPNRFSSNPRRAAFERKSFPLIAQMTAMPRWLLVVAIGSSLLLGLVLTGPVAWLGAFFLLLVAAFLGWLLALSWPLLSRSRQFLRLVIVLALIGLAFLKVTGQF